MRLGSYQLFEQVGSGGFARVYHATGPVGDVAIKILSPVDGALEPDIVKRFEREIALLAKVKHPSLVALLDHGVDPERGPYLVMPLLVGLTLRDVLPSAGFGPEAALRLMTPVVQAVGALHAAGLVHRDLKPENVIVSPRGEVTLVDLGLALGVEQSRLTRAGAVAGSVPYMAPEQIEGDPPLPQSDVWSLGVVLYELVTGTRPFARDRAGDEVAAILAGVFDPLSECDRRVSPELSGLTHDCLQRSPAERPTDAHDLLRRIEMLLDWAPPAAQRSEVVSVLTDLSAYQKSRADDRLQRIHGQAERAASSGDTFAALALLDRALAYRPDDRQTLSLIEAVAAPRTLPPQAIAAKREPARVDAHGDTQHAVPTPRPTATRRPKRGVWFVAVGVLAAVGASAATYFVTRPARERVPDQAPDEEAVLVGDPGDDPDDEALALTPMSDLFGTDDVPDQAPDHDENVGLAALRVIPAEDLRGGPQIDMGNNTRQRGETIVPPRMLGPMGAQGALRHLETLIAAQPGNTELRVGLALALLGNGREREGLAELEALAQSDPELPSLWGARGYVSMRLGRFDEADRFFTRAIQVEPTDSNSLRNRGILRHRRGRRTEGYADLRASLRYDPDDVNALSELAQIYEKTGHRRDARPLLERVVRAQPRNANAWVDLSMAQSDPDESLGSLARAIEISPDLDRAYVQRCTVLARAQRSAAIQACTRAMQAAPDDPWMQMHRGLAHYTEEQTDEALRDMNAAIERRPRDAVMLTNRYLVLQHAGRWAEARRDIQAACDLGHETACNDLAASD